MFKSLMPELLSVKADLPRAISLASRCGFAGVDTSAGHLADPLLDISATSDLLASAALRPGYVSLSPGRVPSPEPDWQAALTQLPLVAQRAHRLGFRRATLVVLPFHDLPFEAAFAQHVRDLNQMTAILDDYDIALGLEYVSPLSRRKGQPMRLSIRSPV